MGKPGAFLDIDRVTHELRPVEERSRDFDPRYFIIIFTSLF